MNFGTRALTPSQFIGRIEDRLRDYLEVFAGLPPERAFLSLASDDEHVKHPPQDKFVTIFPARFPPWQGVVSGGGELGFDVSIRTTAFARLGNDQEYRQSRILRDPKNSILSLMFHVVQAYHLWTMPNVDDETISYLREPMRVVGSGPELTTKKQESNVWVLCWVNWEAKATFVLNPDTAESSPQDPPAY